MVKVTFTVDEKTVATLDRVAAKLNKPKSAIFREAIEKYAEDSDRLTLAERNRMLAVLDRMMVQKPTRTNAQVDEEIAELRATRKTGGRRTRVE